MCRLFAFRSTLPSQAQRCLLGAENALAKQSRAHPDGWGVAYYIHGYPHLFRSINHAFDDRLFHEVSGMISTHTLMAHVRHATNGDVTLFNCHPFQHANWTFMHNGGIKQCVHGSPLYQAILDRIKPRFQRYIAGTTDSELCFYLFLSNLHQHYDCVHQAEYDFEIVSAVLKETVESVHTLNQKFNPAPAVTTFVLTNGLLMIGLVMGKDLHYSTHPTQCWEKEVFPMWEGDTSFSEGPVKHLILSSEDVAANPNVWTRLQNGEMVGVDTTMRFFKRQLIEERFTDVYA